MSQEIINQLREQVARLEAELKGERELRTMIESNRDQLRMDKAALERELAGAHSEKRKAKRALEDAVKTSHEAVEMFKAENAALLKTITDDEQLKVAQAQNAELKDEITNSNKFAQDQENTIAELRAENTRISVENTNLMHKSPSAKMALQIGNIKDELTAARAEVADLKSDAGQLILKFSSMQALGAERDKFKAALELIENAGEYICDDEGLAIECPNFHVAREALAKEQTK